MARYSPVDFLVMDNYQSSAVKTAIYPQSHAIVYPAMGLAGEVGEFLNKYKKVIRDGREIDLDSSKGELGDILWYVAVLADDLGLSLSNIASANLNKLYDRQERGVLGGSGDTR